MQQNVWIIEGSTKNVKCFLQYFRKSSSPFHLEQIFGKLSTDFTEGEEAASRKSKSKITKPGLKKQKIRP